MFLLAVYSRQSRLFLPCSSILPGSTHCPIHKPLPYFRRLLQQQANNGTVILHLFLVAALKIITDTTAYLLRTTQITLQFPVSEVQNGLTELESRCQLSHVLSRGSGRQFIQVSFLESRGFLNVLAHGLLPPSSNPASVASL